MGRTGGMAAAVFMAVGCGEAPLPLPEPPPGAASQILAVSSGIDGRPPLLLAGDLAAPLRYDGVAAAALLLTYELPLSALGLDAGEVLPAPDRPCALSEPVEVLAVDVRRGERLWHDAQLTSEVREQLVPDFATRCVGCTDFRVRAVPYGLEEADFDRLAEIAAEGELVLNRVSGAAWLSDGSALVTTLPPRYADPHPTLYRVTEQAATPLSGCEGGHGAIAPAGRPDELWLTAVGRVERVTVDLGALTCTVTETVPVPDEGGSPNFPLLAVSPDGAELFVGSDTGALFRYAGRAVTFLGKMDTCPCDEGDSPVTTTGRGSLRWIGPGAARMSNGWNRLAVWTEGGGLEVRTLGFLEGGAITAHGEIDGLGLVIGTGQGGVYVEQRGGWRRLEAPIADDVNAILPWGAGMVVVAEARVIERSAGGRWCDPMDISGAADGGRSTIVAPDRVFSADMIETRVSVRQPAAGLWLRAQ